MAKSSIPTAKNSNDTALYISWAGNVTQQQKAFKAMAQSLDEYAGYYRTSAQFLTDFSDLADNVSGRPGLTREDYGRFRPHEAIPNKRKIKEIIERVDEVYQRVGLIRNIIDLMGDFACQGIRVVHGNKRIEKFYRNWWQKVNGKERSERFLNNLYRTGNVIIRRQTARISIKEQDKLMTSNAEADIPIEVPDVYRREIPWKYVFYAPTIIDVVGGPLASFVGKPVYSMKLPESLKRVIQSPSTAEEKALVKQLPKEILAAAKKQTGIPLPVDKTIVYHYKKDDWQDWAFPMIYSIMNDIILLEKLKLADIAALDGAISNIRIFKLGSLEHKIAPTRAAAAKLGEILGNHMGAGTMDLVWGPDIELVESKTQVHQFLGEEKYKPTLNNIYAGLGIPPTLTGTFGAAGTTNNFISLKTLIQRLQYGREVLEKFWNNEFMLIQKALGFRYPAKLEYAWTSLGDEAAEKALLIQMVDRNLISDELFQYYFGNDPEMEEVRLKREHQQREKGYMPPKAGAFYDPQFEIALKKVALQTMVVSPEQVGIELEEGKSRDPLDLKPKLATGPSPAKKGVPQQGRPKNAKDSSKRKQKTFTPKSKAVMEIWANAAQLAIAEILSDDFLSTFKRKNLRSLTAKEQEQSEKIKFQVLCGLKPLGEVSEKVVYDILSASPTSEYHNACGLFDAWVKDVSKQVGRKLTLDELHKLQSNLYILIQGD